MRSSAEAVVSERTLWRRRSHSSGSAAPHVHAQLHSFVYGGGGAASRMRLGRRPRSERTE